jgi:hypothetical protein
MFAVILYLHKSVSICGDRYPEAFMKAIVSGATGAYGTAAVFLALAMGAARVVAVGRNARILNSLAEASGSNRAGGKGQQLRMYCDQSYGVARCDC